LQPLLSAQTRPLGKHLFLDALVLAEHVAVQDRSYRLLPWDYAQLATPKVLTQRPPMELLPLLTVQPQVKETLESPFSAVLLALPEYLPPAKYLAVASPRGDRPVSMLPCWDLQH